MITLLKTLKKSQTAQSFKVLYYQQKNKALAPARDLGSLELSHQPLVVLIES